MNRRAARWMLVAVAVAVPVAATQLPRTAEPAATARAGTGQTRQLTTVTQASLASALRDARASLERAPGSSYTIRLPAGTFDLAGLDNVSGGATIDLSRIDACPGMLTIAGQGMNNTTIITDDRLIGIAGRQTSCVTIADLTMSRRKPDATQGVVVAATPESVTVDIPVGFPDPVSLMPEERVVNRDGRETIRRYLKKYAPSPEGPRAIPDQIQAMWQSATRVPGGPNRWRIDLVIRGRMPEYRPGDLLGIKSKNGFDAYRFIGGENITFRGVRWMMETRGVFRRVDNVTIENCSIVRPPPINGVRFAMASSTGGPQIGQPTDPMTQGHLVTGNDFAATGDDALLFAHANGVVRDNRISDTWGSAMRIYESPGLEVGNNVLIRSRILREVDDKLEGDRNVGRRSRPPRSDVRPDDL